jgi:hypothetical protein
MTLLVGVSLAACNAEPPPPPPAPPPDPLAGLFPPQVAEYYDVAHPGDACLSEAELRSEMLIRLRNDLMVASLTCRSAYGGQEAFADYVDFTVTHQERIRESQHVLGDFLGRYLGGSRARLFDTYITEMANVEAQTVIAMGPPAYCSARRQQFDRAVEFDAVALNEYLDEAMRRFRSEYAMCNPLPAEDPGETIEVDADGTSPDGDGTAVTVRPVTAPAGG